MVAEGLWLIPSTDKIKGILPVCLQFFVELVFATETWIFLAGLRVNMRDP
jgi:hypothetical protein